MDRVTAVNVAVWLVLAALVCLALLNSGGCNTDPHSYWC